ncbi:5-methyltetrahydropteroyltriglutamate--homocysteine S-methyltransferase [Endozoicomonas sp. G2_2]|uniref:5-methyltetrahydropteroyltriglutamate-- homocysteine S-methyltransferase n=1 Tax=Endozoicomonas sp. G2_2 TaxID=2821092 RepID=UPI001ADC7648|nr:5-methyltetrahydropteroyltriglutamate--homocysteine S-methyltransferase [Endozoicomonas sp. G2_2]MBO9470715.1 5-methyltetrahydropteroyltriglutamate--homocysteine S-methyltransferase [Endozoicomonas sp. G2_2]
MTISQNLGFPRIGERRELKKATEAYWKGDLDRAGLEATGAELRHSNWAKQQAAGIDLIPSNDFSFYDQVLGLSCLVGNVPARFGWDGSDMNIDVAFDMARGTDGAIACEMTKWFDTNYHYIVPEFTQDTSFKLVGSKIFDEFAEARAQGIVTKPVMVGPATYLTLGKVTDGSDLNKFDLADSLIDVYVQIAEKLAADGAEWLQIDEPIFSLDLDDTQRAVIEKAYAKLAQVDGIKIMVANYFGGLADNMELFTALPVAALHIDAVRGLKEAEVVAARLDDSKYLSVGIIDGRNIWKTDLERASNVLQTIKGEIGGERLIVGPSCSLLHSPVTLRSETKLDDEFKNWLAFAEEKLDEIVFLANAADGKVDKAMLAANQQAMADRADSARIHDAAVKRRAEAATDKDMQRGAPYAERAKKQHAKLNLPAYPTTTIGSFPQTQEVRKARAAHKKGKMSDADYDAFLEEKIAEAVKMQEDMGFDMLVHGEFERNDMVEYFGEQLAGYAFTKFGWVQSYGSRYVKPPIIFGDVSRPEAMTVKWSKYAQSLTDKPMKGMLTGPVTMVQWAFVRDDQPRSETVKQVALAIRDEVVDLEAAGLAAIQIDEAAFREGLPLRRADWEAYLKWAVECFRLASCGVADDTQIHTHMCYSEFNDIIEAIADMDADCISIETSRSQMELLDAFVQFKYPNEIGPGVYDIHSPRVPGKDEMVDLLHKATEVLPAERVWVNPDCGLKTRGWAEVEPALKQMVEAARELRDKAA